MQILITKLNASLMEVTAVYPEMKPRVTKELNFVLSKKLVTAYVKITTTVKRN